MVLFNNEDGQLVGPMSDHIGVEVKRKSEGSACMVRVPWFPRHERQKFGFSGTCQPRPISIARPRTSKTNTPGSRGE